MDRYLSNAGAVHPLDEFDVSASSWVELVEKLA